MKHWRREVHDEWLEKHNEREEVHEECGEAHDRWDVAVAHYSLDKK